MFLGKRVLEEIIEIETEVNFTAQKKDIDKNKRNNQLTLFDPNLVNRRKKRFYIEMRMEKNIVHEKERYIFLGDDL